VSISLKQLRDIPMQATIDTSIGPLSLFSMRLTDRTNILKSLDKKEDTEDPKEYVKTLLTYLCYPQSNLREGKYRPDETVLTDEDVSKLSDEELEQVADTFLIHNAYFYKKVDHRKKKNNQGEEVTEYFYTEVKHPKLERESNIEYLYRLKGLEEEKELKQYKSMLNNFPKHLSESIEKTNEIGSLVSDAFKRAKALRPIPEPSYDMTMINKVQNDSFSAPFEELGQRLDTLVELSQGAYEYSRRTFEVQTGIASEQKSGGEATGRYAKSNIRFTIVVILLTIGIAVWSNFSGVTFSNEQQQLLGGYAGTVSDALKENSKAIELSSDTSQAALQTIVSALQTLNQSMDSSQVSMEALRFEIDVLKKSNQDYEQKVEMLEAKLNALKVTNTP
jgi:hypothetical protein